MNRLSGTSEQAGLTAEEKRQVRTITVIVDARNEAWEGFKDCEREGPVFSFIKSSNKVDFSFRF